MGVSYRKRGNRWHIRFREKGKKEVTEVLPGSLHESTIKKKVAWWEEQIALGREDPWEKSSGGMLSDLIDEYLAAHKREWADSTYRGNKIVLSIFPDREINKDTPNEFFQKAYEGHDVAATTRKSNRGRINAFLSWLHRQGFPRWKVELPPEARIELQMSDSIKYLSWQQVDDVCRAHRFAHRQKRAFFGIPNAKDPVFYCDLWWFMFYSLLRAEEVPRMKAKHLNGKSLKVYGKGRRVDIITLPPPALEIARRHVSGKQPDDPVFVTHMNRPRRQLEDAIELALGPGRRKGFHLLRHGGVVHYLSLGKPVQFVSKLARHKSIDVTLRVYGDIVPDSMESAFADVKHKPS